MPKLKAKPAPKKPPVAVDPVSGKPMKGFKLMKFLNPERLKDVGKRAGKRSAKSSKHQQWSKAEASFFARRGGLASQRHKKVPTGPGKKV